MPHPGTVLTSPYLPVIALWHLSAVRGQVDGVGELPAPVAEVLPLCGMESIPQKELRNQVGEVLRRVEAGARLTVTVAGRPVAELAPAARRQWVAGPALAAVWQGPTPQELDSDLTRLEAGISDPFER